MLRQAEFTPKRSLRMDTPYKTLHGTAYVGLRNETQHFQAFATYQKHATFIQS